MYERACTPNLDLSVIHIASNPYNLCRDYCLPRQLSSCLSAICSITGKFVKGCLSELPYSTVDDMYF